MTLYEQVASELLKDILKGIYKKGEMLPGENELSDIYRVSRVTVRQALKNLSEMGAIETYRGKGRVVILDAGTMERTEEDRLIYREEFLNSTRVRMMLEPQIAREAALKATDKDLEKIKKTLPSKKRYMPQLLDAFHLALVSACHNPKLYAIMELLLLDEAQMEASEKGILIPPDQQKAIMSEIFMQHEKIYEAVKNKDSEFAYFYMKEHLQSLMDWYNSYFEVALNER